MIKSNKNKGSILLLAIGLLAIIALLGTSFLFVARMNRSVARAISKKSQSENVARGALLNIAQVLKRDLHENFQSDEYLDASTPEKWYMAVDGVDNEMPYGTPGDPSYLRRLQYLDHYLSRNGKTAVAFTGQSTSSPLWINPNDKSSYAYAYNTNIPVEGKSKTYYVTVAVSDLCGKVNLNTARGIFNKTGTTVTNNGMEWTCQSGIRINPVIKGSNKATFVSSITNAVNNFANYTTTTNYQLNFTRHFASNPSGTTNKLLDASNKTVSPFSVAEEAFLRQLNLSSTLTKPTRLSQLAPTLALADRSRITTYSAALNPLRYPSANYYTKFHYPRFDPAANKIYGDFKSAVTALEGLGNNNNTALDNHPLMFYMLGICSTPAEAKTLTADFVSNIKAQERCFINRVGIKQWSYRSMTQSHGDLEESIDGLLERSMGLTVSVDGRPAASIYAAIPQLVITEAFAYRKKYVDPNDASKTSVAEAYAFEIYNPNHVMIDASNYRIYASGKAVTPMLLKGTQKYIRPNGKMVIYNVRGKKYDSATKKFIDVQRSDFGFTGAGQWVQSPNMVFDSTKGGGMVHLCRKVRSYRLNPNSQDFVLPADHFRINDATHSGDRRELAFDSTADFAVSHIMRDNDWYRARSTVAAYIRGTVDGSTDSSISITTASHKLGSANNLNETDLAGTVKYPCPLWVKGEKITGIGDLMNCYLVGLYNSYKLTSYDGVMYSHEIARLGNGTYTDFPHKILELRDKYPDNPIFKNVRGMGRLSALRHPSDCNQWGHGKYIYPDLPIGALLSEFIIFQQGLDAKYQGDAAFGMININTASNEVLQSLPFPTYVRKPVLKSLASQTGEFTAPNVFSKVSIDPALAASTISNYRENIGTSRMGYRSSAPARCFLSAGEIVLPLSKYTLTRTSLSDSSGNAKLDWRADVLSTELYNEISGAITTRSDTFGVYIAVTEGLPSSASLSDSTHIYYAVINRLACGEGLNPAIMLFERVK